MKQAVESPGGLRSPVLIILVLFLVNVFNFVDRQLPFILAESIRNEFGLSDKQLGLMGGLAFAVVYSTMAFPLARLADSWSPKWVLVGSLSMWSLLTAAGGFVQNFQQLLLSRAGVAMGEAGSTPSAHAIISSAIREDRRGFAIALFSVGIPVGGMLGLVLGGWLNDATNWRTAMTGMGLPGLALALLAMLILPSVSRGSQKNVDKQSFLTSFRNLWSLKSFRHLCIGITIVGIPIYGSYLFTAPFLIRTYELTAATAGLWLGVSNGITGMLSVLFSGWLSDWLGRRRQSYVLMLPAMAFIIAAPVMVLTYLAPTPLLAVLLHVPVQMCMVAYVAPCFGIAQKLAKPAERAMASALLLFGLSLIGASVGPYFIGLVSDFLRAHVGEAALRYALCLSAAFLFWGATHLWISSRAVEEDLAARQA